MNGEPVVAGHEMSGQSDGIVFTRNGSVGRITLDRPKSLNALTLDIVHALHACLDEWQRAAGTVLVFDSSSDKAFCAGGDVRRIRQNALAGRHADNVEFFTAEYELNLRLAELDTPLVSVIDGICFGGGLGLSVHGAFRVLTERATLAMPETGIGFLPDVGASYFLSRLPGAVGTYLGLTGYRLDAADALYVGLGTHRVADAGMVISAPRAADRFGRSCSPGLVAGNRPRAARSSRISSGRHRLVFRSEHRDRDTHPSGRAVDAVGRRLSGSSGRGLPAEPRSHDEHPGHGKADGATELSFYGTRHCDAHCAHARLLRGSAGSVGR